jgi:hypothetical protein
MTTPFDAFGPGVLVVTRTDVANSTPVNVGYANTFNVQFQGSIKELYGQNQLPLDAARGTIKVTGKITAACLSGIAWNNCFFGDTFTSGGIQWNLNEAHSVPGTTPFTVTATNGATFDQDLGVTYAVTGLPFTKVASVSAIGQYSVNTSTGVYTFYSGDASAAILLTYTSTVTGGQTLAINNQLLGYAPLFQLDYYTMRNNAALVARFYQCQLASLNLPAKLEDFMMPEMEVHMFANTAGQLGKLYFPQVS